MKTSRTGQRVCHEEVMHVAKAAAGEHYEVLMKDNEFYKVWQRQNPNKNGKQLQQAFIDRNWGKYLEFARATLVEMLKRPDVEEMMKGKIMDVLEKDWSVRNKRFVN